MYAVQLSVVTLQSNIGQQWMNESTTKNQALVDHYVKYGDMPSLSGAVALLTLFNAINVAYRVKMSQSESDEEFKRVQEQLHAGNKIEIDLDEILKYQDKYIDKKESSSGRQRMTLPEMEHLAMRLGFGTLLKFASATENPTKKLAEFIKGDQPVFNTFQNANQFKSFLCQKLNVAVSGIIANYDSSIIFNEKETKKGANIVYGLVAACKGDRFLLLDGGVQGPIWVHIERLFEAMSKTDVKNGLPMGTLSIYELM